MPREFPDTSQVEFSAKVDKADYEEFIGHLPIHGATAWLIRGALKNINEKLRDDPSLTLQLRESISELVRQT